MRQHVNDRLWISTKGFILLFGILFTLPLAAKVPEPDTVFYGTVQHLTDQDLIPSTGEVIRVKAVVNGVALATYTMMPGVNTYILKVPMDDGLLPRIPNTAKAGDIVHIFLENPGEGLEFEVNQTAPTGIPLSAERGAVSSLNLNLEENLKFQDVDMDGLSDDWEIQHFGDTSRDGSGDYDNDGVSDYDEFIAGTDPTDNQSFFRIMAEEMNDDTFTVKFAPALKGRTYTVLCTEDSASDQWVVVEVIQPVSDSAEAACQDEVPGVSKRMYKVMVTMD